MKSKANEVHPRTTAHRLEHEAEALRRAPSRAVSSGWWAAPGIVAGAVIGRVMGALAGAVLDRDAEDASIAHMRDSTPCPVPTGQDRGDESSSIVRRTFRRFLSASVCFHGVP